MQKEAEEESRKSGEPNGGSLPDSLFLGREEMERAKESYLFADRTRFTCAFQLPANKFVSQRLPVTRSTREGNSLHGPTRLLSNA